MDIPPAQRASLLLLAGILKTHTALGAYGAVPILNAHAALGALVTGPQLHAAVEANAFESRAVAPHNPANFNILLEPDPVGVFVLIGP